MSYGEVHDRLATHGERSITAFPDGSVDIYYTVADVRGERIEDRATFGERIAEAETATFPVEHRSTEAGGQAPNMARQADALGAATTLLGHLDDPVFGDLDFETVSMGEPARVIVYPLADEDVLFAEGSNAVEEWTLDTLYAACDSPRDHLTADAVCCGNWASIPGLTDALSDLAAFDGSVFVLDPGPIATRSREAVANLFRALGDLDGSYDVVVSLDRAELDYTMAALGIDADDPLDRLRVESGITAAVLHAESEATAAIGGGEPTVANLEVENPTRRTGAGDRFSAGLAAGLAEGWGWEPALALGNCCAAYYVETGDTGSREDLRAYLDDRDH